MRTSVSIASSGTHPAYRATAGCGSPGRGCTMPELLSSRHPARRRHRPRSPVRSLRRQRRSEQQHERGDVACFETRPIGICAAICASASASLTPYFLACQVTRSAWRLVRVRCGWMMLTTIRSAAPSSDRFLEKFASAELPRPCATPSLHLDVSGTENGARRSTADEDDAPAAGLAHMRQRGARTADRDQRLAVNARHDLAVGRGLDRFRGAIDAGRGVVHQDIEASKPGRGLIHHPLARGAIEQVGLQGKAFRPARTHRRRGLFQFGRIPSADRDACALLGESDCEFAPQARGSRR